MERVEGAYAQCGAVFQCEGNAGLPGALWEFDLDPNAELAILFKIGPGFLRFGGREVSDECLPVDRVRNFRPIEWSEPDRWFGGEPFIYFQ